MKYLKTYENFLNENKGENLADELIKKARAKMKTLSDDDIEEFRKRIALAFDLKIN